MARDLELATEAVLEPTPPIYNLPTVYDVIGLLAG
jgi:hypothetical protein